MRALEMDYAHQVRPVTARKSWMGGLALFSMAMAVLLAALAVVAMNERLHQLEARLASSEVCMKNLHIIMWRNKSEALVAAVDCPAAGAEE